MRQITKKTIALLCLLIGSLFLLASCGGDQADAPAESGETNTSEESAGTSDSADSNDSDDSETVLQEQQEADIVLDPEALAQSATTFDPSITDGETLFVSYCAKCHGLEGLGNGPSAGSLNTASGMNLAVAGAERSDEELQTTITEGKGVEMPPWGLVLTPEQIESLMGYVRGFASG